jgi:hypothetical protein
MSVLEVVTPKHETRKVILAVKVIGTTLLWGTVQHEHSLHHYAGHFLCFHHAEDERNLNMEADKALLAFLFAN